MVEIILNIVPLEPAKRKHTDFVYDRAIRITGNDCDHISDASIVNAVVSMPKLHVASLIANGRIFHLDISGRLEIDVI